MRAWLEEKGYKGGTGACATKAKLASPSRMALLASGNLSHDDAAERGDAPVGWELALHVFPVAVSSASMFTFSNLLSLNLLILCQS